jgi:hypothetical protein
VYPMPYFLGGKVSSSPLYAQLEHCWTNIVLALLITAHN